jgi:hypothetical protein
MSAALAAAPLTALAAPDAALLIPLVAFFNRSPVPRHTSPNATSDNSDSFVARARACKIFLIICNSLAFMACNVFSTWGSRAMLAAAAGAETAGAALSVAADVLPLEG